ncbi:MAG: glycosyltransferase family 4 protein [Verrucomicrobiota bacterium]|nr:glycosyltransferase family 4 protein [Limisphaera sp.]MDW8380937.1 glycosyltransferase family 4 protein [Verrucomicrobiota bacterium]
MGERRRVLLSAYACEPGRGSEPEVGWRWATELARYHDITVVTRANNRIPIESALLELPPPHPQFLFFDPPGPWVRWKARGLPVALFYAIWQWSVRKYLRARLRTFDLVHHLTFNSFRQPGYWWDPIPPVVLGPLGGGQICPWPFLWHFGSRVVPELLRSLTVISAPVLPHLHQSFRAAARILVANADTARRIPARYRDKARSLLETGVMPDQVLPPRPARTDHGVRVLWLSRMEKIKAGTLAVAAYARALRAEPRLRLSMAGDGPDGGAVKATAVRLGVASAIDWHGRVPREMLLSLFAAHDIFLFTSLRDTSGNALLEAMAAGLPAISLLHHGQAEIATDETAIRVPPIHPQQTIQALADALVRLARDPELRRRMGEAARQRVLDLYIWPRKAQMMNQIYEEVWAETGFRAAPVHANTESAV